MVSASHKANNKRLLGMFPSELWRLPSDSECLLLEKSAGATNIAQDSLSEASAVENLGHLVECHY